MELGIEQTININNSQSKFIETTLGKCVSSALDLGIRYIFPDLIENQIIDLKDNLLKYGFKNGFLQSFNDIKSFKDVSFKLLKGNLKTVDEFNLALKEGGIIDSFSKILSHSFSSLYRSNIISYQTSVTLNKFKNTIIDSFRSNLNSSYKAVKKADNEVSKFIEQFNTAKEERDVSLLKDLFNKIEKQREELLPLEKQINQINEIEKVFNHLNLNNFSQKSFEELDVILNFN